MVLNLTIIRFCAIKLLLLGLYILCYVVSLKATFLPFFFQLDHGAPTAHTKKIVLHLFLLITTFCI